MSDREASRTALATAYMRAVHQLFDGEPRILEDPIVVRLIGETALQRINDPVNRYRSSEIGALRAHVVLRSRFAEDRLAAAVLRSVTQYVILGAGLDTFAYRQPGWARALKIIEVDHVGTQTMKRSSLTAAGLAVPENVTFANVDFEHESLRDGLLRYEVSLDEPTFFSWLGVTVYLNEDAIDAVLRSVAAFRVGSEIVLTFRQPIESATGKERDRLSRLAEHVASVGEPYVTYFEPDALEDKLRSIGFSKVEFLSSADAEERYFRQRPKDLPLPTRTGLVSAVV
ncbi:MAG: class I SAM-dependent methyltransferase [Desulfomonilaceae bacterium]